MLHLPSACIGLLFILTACMSHESNRTLRGNIAYFSTQAYEGAEIPQEVLRRAAEMTLRQQHTHFTLTRNDSVTTRYPRPGINISYGRSPYGFSDPGLTGSGGGLSAGLSLAPPRMEWAVHMMSVSAPADAYDAHALLAD